MKSAASEPGLRPANGSLILDHRTDQSRFAIHRGYMCAGLICFKFD